jgi:hypothetical protein
MKTTPWFEAGKENPVRVGVYQVSYCNGTRYKEWNGARWGWSCYTPHSAELESEFKYAAQNCFQWRGLLKESK